MSRSFLKLIVKRNIAKNINKTREYINKNLFLKLLKNCSSLLKIENLRNIMKNMSLKFDTKRMLYKKMNRKLTFTSDIGKLETKAKYNKLLYKNVRILR